MVDTINRPLFGKFAFERHNVHNVHNVPVAENLLLAVDGSSKGDNMR